MSAQGRFVSGHAFTRAAKKLVTRMHFRHWLLMSGQEGEQLYLGGAVTVSVTVGPVLVELMLLDTTPFESTPTIVKV